MKAAAKGARRTLAQHIQARRDREKHEKAIYARGYRRGQTVERQRHHDALEHLHEQIQQRHLEFASLQRMTESAAEQVRYLGEQVEFWRKKATEAHPALVTPTDGQNATTATAPLVDETHG